MRTPTPITILGLSGTTEGGFDRFREALLDLERKRYPDGYTDKESRAEARSQMIGELFHAVAVLNYHNGAVALIRAYQAAERKVHAAKYAAQEGYSDLNARTTIAWHAAHHRYIAAIHDAEAAYAELAEATARLVAHHKNGWSGEAASFYNQLVTAEQRLDVAGLDQIAERDTEHELTLFREQHRENLHLLSYTITGGVPAGYEPDPIPTEAEPEYVSPYRTRDW
jgi:hypothetical protein